MQLTDGANDLDEAGQGHGIAMAKPLGQRADDDGTKELAKERQTVHQRSRGRGEGVLLGRRIVRAKLSDERREGLNTAEGGAITVGV